MIRRILALLGISAAIALAQSARPEAATGRQPSAPDPRWTPPKTSWGEPDLQGIWPLNHLIAVPLERPRQYGNRLYLTDEELAKAQSSLEARNRRFQSGPIPVADTSARVIPTNAAPPLDSQIRQWLGESRGHWEGNTLVVETTNFNGQVGMTSAGVPGSPGPLQPSTPNMRVIERFTRVSPDTIDFRMT